MGLLAAGVNGIKLEVGQEVIGAEVIPSQGEIFFIGTDGKKRRRIEIPEALTPVMIRSFDHDRGLLQPEFPGSCSGEFDMFKPIACSPD